MTAKNPIYGIDDLTRQMRSRGYIETEFVVDWDMSGNVLVRARYEPGAMANYSAIPNSSPTAKEVAAAVSHEQGMNVWKGALCVLVIFAGIFVAGALGWI